MTATCTLSSPVVVMDNGSATSKIGFSGTIEPQCVIASAVGTKQHSSSINSNVCDDMDHITGDPSDVCRYSNSYQFKYMIRNGMIKDWDSLQNLWQASIYDHMRCNPEDHAFLISESALNSASSREQMAEIMFETFNIPSLLISPQPILSLVASWGAIDDRLQNLSGTVVDCGDTTTTIFPVADGYILPHSVRQLPIGGRDITAVVQSYLRKKKRGISSTNAFAVARSLKETHGYVCSNFEKEQNKGIAKAVSGTLFNGDTWSFTAGDETFLAGEVLFRPKLACPMGEHLPLPDLVDLCIQDSPMDARRNLYSNIVLSGGSSVFPGFGRRLQRDLKRVITRRTGAARRACGLIENEGSGVEVNVASHTNQKHAAWLGGSIMASDPRFESWCVTREQYEEAGPGIARNFHRPLFHHSS